MLFVSFAVGYSGEVMSSCEICGGGTNTKLCLYAGAKLQMCSSCIEKMGVVPLTNYAQQKPKNQSPNKGFGGYSNTVKSRNNVMRETVDIKSNFAKLVAKARQNKGWTKEELALKISEKVNVVKRIEQGIRPGDKIIKKIEKCLNIKLMEEHSHAGHSKLKGSSDKGFTMGDYFGKKR